MAGGDEMVIPAKGAARVGAALLFIGAGTNVYDAFSAVMSSPWSTEKFTNDTEEAKMAKRYVKHAIVISWTYAIIGALLVGRKLALFPLLGAAIVTGYMSWLYRSAINRGASGKGMKAHNGHVANGSTGTDGRSFGSSLGPLDILRPRD